MKLIMGLIPVKDRYFLDIVLPVIRPGIEEIANKSMGEYDYYSVVQDLLSGAMQLYMAYVDHDGITEKEFQKAFIGKLNDPTKDYVGFSIIQLLHTSLHIFQGYVAPEYRNTDVLGLGFTFLESQAKLLGAPYLSFAGVPEWGGMKDLGFTGTYQMHRKKI